MIKLMRMRVSQEAVHFRDWAKMSFYEYSSQSWETLLPYATADARDLVSKLVVYESGNRLTAKQALEHAYFRTSEKEVANE